MQEEREVIKLQKEELKNILKLWNDGAIHEFVEDTLFPDDNKQ